MTQPSVLPDSQRIAQLEVHVQDVHDDVHDVREAVRDFRTEVTAELKTLRGMLSSRPSWAVSALITVLSSATVGMAVALVTGTAG